ncbi:ABC transporter ATP-binding protein/permease [Flavobacteriales bacterium]|nr:ABC transporter ATP-binding protein/permease [Flavobacteriales bacterium]MDA7596185.1 ABC transporter ATP-binding protein/permease [Flavobacteriales bacterium]
MTKNKTTVKQAFKEFIWPRKWIVLTGLLLIVISRLSSLVLPLKSKELLDVIIPNKDLEALAYLVIIVASAIFIQSLTSFALARLLSVEAQLLISKLRVKVQKQMLSLPISFFDNNKSGALVSRIMTDVEGVRNIIGTGLVQLFGGSITAIISLLLLLNISVELTLLVLTPVLLFAVIAIKAFGYIRPIFRKRGQINAEVNGRLTETMNGVRVIKGFNAEHQESESFSLGVKKLFENVKKSLTATAIMTSSSAFLLGLASVGIMGMGGKMIIEGNLTTGDFLSFTLLLGFMIAPIVQMSNIGSQLTEAFAGLDRTNELMNISSEYDNLNRNIKLVNVIGNIEFQNVSFAYDKGKEVVNNISFNAQKGTVTALVGSSGSGKSTIASLIASFISPISGSIYVDESNLAEIDLKSFRSHLGVVLQDDFLFEGTIRENILFPRPHANEAQLLNAVHSSYVNEFTDRFEKGLDTLIGERGVKLSGGQRQRIAIARAILANPKILILDEATSNLDAESETLIQKSLNELMKGRTTFVIAHRLSTIRKANQILVIENGEIAEHGTHDDLIKQKGRYYDLVTFQSVI